MNILVIGNGFDLAHGLPTKYGDFLDFLNKINITSLFDANEQEYTNKHIKDWKIGTEVSNYVIKAFRTKIRVENANANNEQEYIQELYDNVRDNFWFKHFLKKYTDAKSIGINWIDFESEIKRIIKGFDNIHNSKYDEVDPTKLECYELKNLIKSHRLNDNTDKKRYIDLINELENDLKRLIRCLEVYLEDCVGKIDIPCISPDIQGISIDNVLSFNYTNTFAKVYDTSNSLKYHFIHGKANIFNKNNDMVLGIDEYLPGEMKNVDTNCIVFKKYYQRIIKETGNKYTIWLKDIKKAYSNYLEKGETIKSIYGELVPNQPYEMHNVYIWGHSLDITDEDVLKDLILNPNVVTTIFYRNKDQQSEQIANLVKVITQRELIERTSRAEQTIIFKQQNDMIRL